MYDSKGNVNSIKRRSWKAKAKLLGHPVHQMLIVFPLGLLAKAVMFDLIHLAADNPAWANVSYYLIAAGLIGGLVAAPFGYIDWHAIPRNIRIAEMPATLSA